MRVTKRDLFGLPLHLFTGTDYYFSFGMASVADVMLCLHVFLDSAAAVCVSKYFFGLFHDW